MLTLSDAAQNKIRELLAARQDEGLGVRLRITGRRSTHFEYDFGLTYEKDSADDDVVFEYEGFRLYIDSESSVHLDGASIDFNGLGQGGFKIENPSPVWETDLAKTVAEVIETKINPGVAMHGGFVTLVDVKEDVAFIQMGGGCMGCGLANITLKQGIDKMIREAVPDIAKVVDTTPHSEGTNPFYEQQIADQPVAGQQSPLG